MSAEIIHLWGGEHEHRMRVPHDGDMRGPATLIRIKDWPKHWPPKNGKRRIRLSTVEDEPDEPEDRQA